MRQILGIALFALLVHDVFGPHGFIAMRRTQMEIEQIREQIGKMNEENKSLSDQVNSLKTDPKSIERIAREEMGLARPGEMIFKLPDTAKPPSSARFSPWVSAVHLQLWIRSGKSTD